MTSSGTTGEPKVIPINSINLENYIKQINIIATFEKGDTFSQIPNLTFDLSIHDLFLSFFHKGTLIPIGTEMTLFLNRFIEKMNINHIMSVPSFLELGIKNKICCDNKVKNIFLCGEALRTDVAQKILKTFPKANCFNLYGPTECTIAVLYFKFSGEVINLKSDQIPIGKPFFFNEVFLSEMNELLISGKQVFKGYLSNTESPFVFNKKRKFYKTGDICQLRNNNYHFIGRIGFQIKYRGYRVEIEGLEIYLSKLLQTEIILIPHNEISKCNYKEITIFHTNKDLEFSNIKKLLPPFLNSVLIECINEIPRTKSYKVNRKKIFLDYL
jgi:D-alanine--poly(phosphoribitol) ligase subunit 1